MYFVELLFNNVQTSVSLFPESLPNIPHLKSTLYGLLFAYIYNQNSTHTILNIYSLSVANRCFAAGRLSNILGPTPLRTRVRTPANQLLAANPQPRRTSSNGQLEHQYDQYTKSPEIPHQNFTNKQNQSKTQYRTVNTTHNH